MTNFEKNDIGITKDHKFARDVIHYVLHEYMTGLNWIPTGIFGEKDPDSPFTLQLKHTIKNELEYDGHRLHMIYDEFFPDKSVIDKTYLEICRKSKARFVSEKFNIMEFISFSILLASFAGLSYHYGMRSAPFISYKLLVETLRELKEMKKADDNIWNELETILENGKWPKRLWKSELDSSVKK